MTICDCCGAEIKGNDRAHVSVSLNPATDVELAALATEAEIRARIDAGEHTSLDVCGTCIDPIREAVRARRRANN